MKGFRVLAALATLVALLALPLASRTDASWLGGLIGGASSLLSPSEAFKLNVRAVDDHTLVADFNVAKGYYLYRERIHFSLRNTPNVAIQRVSLPPGEAHTDPYFGVQRIFYAPFQAAITLGGVPARQLTLLASYQGCSLKGVCYPPQNQTFHLNLTSAGRSAATLASTHSAASPTGIGSLFQRGGASLVVASFFGFGLLLAFTPCMLPMLPILSGLIVGQGERLDRVRSLILSAAYVLGMAITYALAGVAAGLTGTLLSNALQTPWALGAFALVFVLLALSMFGVYDLQLPSAWQSRLHQHANRLPGGRTAGVFLMGAVSALIVGPCVAAPLAGALLYIGQTHDVWLGGAALFALAVGMGFPLVLIGASAGFLLPCAGPWMAAVKKGFGVLLLGTAIWIISPFLPGAALMLLVAALLVAMALLLHVFDRLSAQASDLHRLGRGLGVICLLAGAVYLASVIGGGSDILHPLAGWNGQASAQSAEALPFERIRSGTDLDRRLRNAAGRAVMLDFYADWCVSCKEMEHGAFADPRVRAKLKDAMLLKADVTANSPDDQALLKRFGLFGPPGILFFDRQGREINGARVVGYQDADRFLKTLEKAFP